MEQIVESIKQLDFNKIKYFVEDGQVIPSNCIDILMNEPVYSKSFFDIAKYLIDNGADVTTDLFIKAIQYNNLDMIRYLHSKSECDEDILMNQVYYTTYMNLLSGENTDMIQYFLIERDYSFESAMEIEEYIMTIGDDDLFKLNHQLWYQMYKYKKGIVDKYTLHIHNKVKKIQKMWLQYYYNPRTKIGKKIMMENIEKCVNDLKL